MNKVVIFVEGGLVQEVLCSEPTKVVMLDRDINGESPETDDRIQEVRPPCGDSYHAFVSIDLEPAHPDEVEHWFSQVKG